MKSFVMLAALLASAFAQGINIGSPTEGSTISPGDLTVQINRPNFISQAEEVAVVIAISPCNGPDGACSDPINGLGWSVLYNGPYDPQYPANPRPQDQPQENFTVNIPDYLAGKSQLSVLHVSLIGLDNTPFLEVVNTTLNVQ
ncbi:unnamed protein product [Peniophora sp. CBMAI 1063]|nr:unnamed protein product [Peniophora sp. CBMAI 1063]